MKRFNKPTDYSHEPHSGFEHPPVPKQHFEHEYEPKFDHDHQNYHMKQGEHYNRYDHDDHQPQFKSIQIDKHLENHGNDHYEPQFKSLSIDKHLDSHDNDHYGRQEYNFPSYNELDHVHHEPKFVSDMPHLPPPPEMMEMQKNSFFPVDVPKIGAKTPYRPPELLFDEYHRRNSFQEEPEPVKRRAGGYPKINKPMVNNPLAKFSDLNMINKQNHI